MPWKSVKVKGGWKVKNLTTKKLSKNTFSSRANADIQVKNRYRFQRKMNSSNNK